MVYLYSAETMCKLRQLDGGYVLDLVLMGKLAVPRQFFSVVFQQVRCCPRSSVPHLKPRDAQI